MRLLHVLTALLMTACAPIHCQTEPPEPRISIADALPPPPPGTVRLQINDFRPFCRREPDAVICAGRDGVRLTLDQIRSVDATLRAEFRYVADDAQYGVEDYWTNNRREADCEDYALMLAERMADAGASGASMKLVIWVTPTGGGHATLAIMSQDDGEYEIGVGRLEVPRPMDWNYGYRHGYIVMDGRQWVTNLGDRRFWR
jgi:predicted transglutaminase-like cysteine proteinase